MDRNLLREELSRDEGIRLRAYKDSVGLWTIGIGHLLGDTQRMTEITMREANALFSFDVEDAIALAADAFGVDVEDENQIDDVRARVLVNMCFNLGSRIRQFVQLIKAVQDKDWVMAETSMRQSKWAGQVGQRAVRLQRMMSTGKVL